MPLGLPVGVIGSKLSLASLLCPLPQVLGLKFTYALELLK